ncbi:TetR/AcrR family transcriptional regulator [Gorillibacterium sp. sgz5001074]|uniref:TetR/AcrR family transcriptional regulator n=1 Tax=Gorillibacterium sp. sgz5001074 TaxID=3446695 RepID=UPI003F681B50
MSMKEQDKVRQPRQQRSQEKKQRIVEAAARLFDAKGYYHTNTKEIAKEAGVAVGSVYAYFPDKREIFLAVLASFKERFFQVIEEGILQIPVGPADKREATLRIIHLILEAHHLFDFLNPDLETLSQSDPDIRLLSMEGHGEGIRMTQAILERWSKELKVRDLEAASAIVYYTLRRILDLIAHKQSPLEEGRLIGELTDMLMAYLFGETRPAD